jgi:hypothetical protein
VFHRDDEVGPQCTVFRLGHDGLCVPVAAKCCYQLQCPVQFQWGNPGNLTVNDSVMHDDEGFRKRLTSTLVSEGYPLTRYEVLRIIYLVSYFFNFDVGFLNLAPLSEGTKPT